MERNLFLSWKEKLKTKNRVDILLGNVKNRLEKYYSAEGNLTTSQRWRLNRPSVRQKLVTSTAVEKPSVNSAV